MTSRARSTAMTKRRIVDACYEEHAEYGIVGASLERIAERAGVGVGTVYRHFPAYEQLVIACGEITFERLALPDEARAAEIFSSRMSKRRRIERLVQETFSFYSRGPEAIRNVRNERSELPELLEEPHQLIESGLDELTRAALSPFNPSDRQVATVRALLDFDSWRALLARDIRGQDAVETAASVVEAWLRRA